MANSSVRFLSLVGNRQSQVRMMARAHAMAADQCERSGKLLGVPVVILMTIVGTSSFASLATLGNTRFWALLLSGVLSTASAILAALQAFFNFGPRSLKHAEAAARLTALAFRFDVLWRLRDDEAIENEITLADAEMKAVALAAPRVTIAMQKAAQAAIDAESTSYNVKFDEDEGETTPPKRPSIVFSSPPS